MTAATDVRADRQGEDASRLAALRAQLDVLNGQLLETLEARGLIVQEVMAIKRRSGMARHDPKREAEMITALLRRANSVYPAAALRYIFDAIFTASRELASEADTNPRARGDGSLPR